MDEKWMIFQSKLKGSTLYLLRNICKKHNKKIDEFLKNFIKNKLKNIEENKNE